MSSVRLENLSDAEKMQNAISDIKEITIIFNEANQKKQQTNIKSHMEKSQLLAKAEVARNYLKQCRVENKKLPINIDVSKIIEEYDMAGRNLGLYILNIMTAVFSLLGSSESNRDFIHQYATIHSPLVLDEILKYMGGMLTQEDKNYALRLASARGSYLNLFVLIKYGAQIESTGKDTGRSALHFAVMNQHLDSVIELLNLGDPDQLLQIRDTLTGQTPVDYVNAIKSDNMKIQILEAMLTSLETRESEDRELLSNRKIILDRIYGLWPKAESTDYTMKL